MMNCFSSAPPDPRFLDGVFRFKGASVTNDRALYALPYLLLLLLGFSAAPDFHAAPVAELISDEYADKRRALIDMEEAMQRVRAGDVQLDHGDTIYLATADKDGMMVSLIQSNFYAMGSGLVPDGLGFVLQNRGALFSLDPGHPNRYEPGKRPFHTIIPAFMTRDGRPVKSFGVMGGPMQPQGHVQIVVNLVDFGLNLQEAGDAARYNHSGSTRPSVVGSGMNDGGTLSLESGFSSDVIEDLRDRGHEVEITVGPFGGYQAIWRDPETGVYYGASEVRQDGAAAGY